MTPREQQICDLYLNTDMSQTEISRQLNVTSGYIWQVIKRNNISCPEKEKVKVSDEQIKQINDLYLNTNLIESEIAKKCNLPYGTIRRIIKKYNPITRDRKNSDKQLDNLIKINENYFENIDTPDKAWILGFIAGDGCLHTIKDSKYLITIGLSEKDISVLEKIKHFLNSEHNILYENVSDGQSNKIHKSVKLAIGRKKIFNDLVKLGISPDKSSILNFPDISENLIVDFIRGIHCSDGNWFIDNDNQITFGIACPVLNFLETLQNILIKNCDLNKNKLTMNNNCYKLSYMGNEQCRRIYNYLYPDYPQYENNYPRLDRKYNYAKNHFDNLDKGIITRNLEDGPISQHTNMKTNAKEKLVKIKEPLPETNLLKLLLR